MNRTELKTMLHEWIDSSDDRLLRLIYSFCKVYNTDKTTAEESTNTTGQELYRLVYSSSRHATCDEACLEDILISARENNPPLDITGLLIHTEDRFLQILEGPLANVMMIYNKISKDPRHGGSQIRFCQPVSERHFGNWHMASKDIDEKQVDYNTNISEEEKKLYESLMDGDLNSYKDDSMRILKTFLAVS